MFTDKEIQRLLDIAQYGSHTGQISAARTVFEAVLAFRPEHSGALLGLAHNHITVGEYEKAREILNSVLERNSRDNDAKALLGLSWFLSGDKEKAKPLLEEAKNGGSASKQLAEELLLNM